MSDQSKVLEKSLDEIISGGAGGSRPRAPRGIQKSRGGPRRRERHDRPFRSVPKNKEAEKLSEGKEYLRVRNLHPELTEQDISSLFSKVGEVKFCLIQFGTNGVSTGTAFVGFVNPDDCRLAIEQFDGRKAAGQIISVENAVDLAARISVGSKRAPRKERKPREKKPAKSVEELDAELQSYMAASAEPFPAVSNGEGMSLD